MKTHYEAVNSCQFCGDSDDEKILTASDDKTLAIWVRNSSRLLGVVTLILFGWGQDPHTGLQLQGFSGHQKSVSSCHFIKITNRIASASWDKSLKLWNVETGKEMVI